VVVGVIAMVAVFVLESVDWELLSVTLSVKECVPALSEVAV
jgi:hypothetical protein